MLRSDRKARKAVDGYMEGMQLGVRELARAEARMETGGKVGPAAAGILSNIGAMQLAIDEAAVADRFSPDEVLRIHEKLMERSPTAHIGGRFRTVQPWI